VTVDELIPRPLLFESFRRSRERFIPETAGCYVLATFEQTVIYLGLAKDLRRRMSQHLDTPEKILLTPMGRAVLFFWIEDDNINKIERTWMNMHIERHGALPVLNRMYSPTST
jgi:hypothetical protein